MLVIVKKRMSFDVKQYTAVSNIAFDSATNTYTITYSVSGVQYIDTVSGADNYVFVMMNTI